MPHISTYAPPPTSLLQSVKRVPPRRSDGRNDSGRVRWCSGSWARTLSLLPGAKNEVFPGKVVGVLGQLVFPKCAKYEQLALELVIWRTGYGPAPIRKDRTPRFPKRYAG
eukprot:gene20091-biopygen1016